MRGHAPGERPPAPREVYQVRGLDLLTWTLSIPFCLFLFMHFVTHLD